MNGSRGWRPLPRDQLQPCCGLVSAACTGSARLCSTAHLFSPWHAPCTIASGWWSRCAHCAPAAAHPKLPPDMLRAQQPMLEWLANNYKKFGCVLEFVTDRSEEVRYVGGQHLHQLLRVLPMRCPAAAQAPSRMRGPICLPVLHCWASPHCAVQGNQFCKGFGGIGGVLRYSVRMGWHKPGLGWSAALEPWLGCSCSP